MDIILEEKNDYTLLFIPQDSYGNLRTMLEGLIGAEEYLAKLEINLDMDEIFYNSIQNRFENLESLLNTLSENNISFQVKSVMLKNLGNISCNYKCLARDTESCKLCENNNRYINNLDTGYNIECSSSICAFKNNNGRCGMHLGKGKVSQCKDEEMPF